MVTARLTLLVAIALSALPAAQSAAPPKLVVPNVADVRIETRRTSDRQAGLVVTEILYLKGARRRWEERVENVEGRGPLYARISQCDQRRTLTLNHAAKTYAYDPIENPASYMRPSSRTSSRQTQVRQGASGPTPTPTPTPTPAPIPTPTITIDAVDTGERKPFGRYTARHVITTRTIDYGPTESTVDRQDGWYIDTPEPDCIAWEGVTTVLFRATGPGTSPPDVVVKKQGDTRRGHPIEETHQMGMGGRYPVVSRIELVDISEAPLDDGLFTTPADYRAALPHPYGGYDLSKPDTLLNRLQSYRQVVADWADYIRRYGLQGILPGTQPPARY